ncbi:BQ2448_1261 [Microbotryum intermedium]|uniref:BQ2448_1261 protein n=1 Tax=Microbotryum intermedium TaxID=269621 RepID=A0A238F9P6_9BASI|nr:BQ2448_1261 [Microbotryum intermedium]
MLGHGHRSLWTAGLCSWSPSQQAGFPGISTLIAVRFTSNFSSSPRSPVMAQLRLNHPPIRHYIRDRARSLPSPLLSSGLAQCIHSARGSVSGVQLSLQRRAFRSTRPRHDVLFVSVPAFKASVAHIHVSSVWGSSLTPGDKLLSVPPDSALLTVVRVSLIFLPVAWRWGMFKRFPKGAWRLGGTARWRLLLMSEREELAWSNTRFEETIANDQCVLMPPEDPRVEPVRKVIERLVQTLNDGAPLSFAQYLQEEMVSKVGSNDSKRSKIVPSARIEVANMPWMPETSNPEKKMKGTWDLYCIDLPKINAFVLSSKDFFVYSGLLSLVEDDENLLAAVLAHECIHLNERHSVEELGFLALSHRELTRATLRSGVVFDVLRGTAWALTLSFPMVGDALSAFFTFVDRKVGQRAYSRKLETEADELGLELMARAGFDPRASITLWEILNEVEQDVQERGEHGKIVDHIALLRTHPSGEQRLDNLKKHLPAAIELYEHTLREKEGQLAAQQRMREQEVEHHRIQQEEDEQRRAAAAAARKATERAREAQQKQQA